MGQERELEKRKEMKGGEQAQKIKWEVGWRGGERSGRKKKVGRREVRGRERK